MLQGKEITAPSHTAVYLVLVTCERCWSHPEQWAGSPGWGCALSWASGCFVSQFPPSQTFLSAEGAPLVNTQGFVCACHYLLYLHLVKTVLDCGHCHLLMVVRNGCWAEATARNIFIGFYVFMKTVVTWMDLDFQGIQNRSCRRGSEVLAKLP